MTWKKKITKNSVPKNIDLTIEFKIVIMITSLISDIIAKFKTFNDSYFLLIKTIKQIVIIDNTIDEIEIIILVIKLCLFVIFLLTKHYLI